MVLLLLIFSFFFFCRITLGNQVDGVRLVDPQLIASFTERYPQADAVLTRPPPQPPN